MHQTKEKEVGAGMPGPSGKTAIAINFHGIGTPGSHVGPEESPYWISTERFEEILSRISVTDRTSDIFITFDDGNHSDFEIAAPLLEAKGLHARFFVVTDRIGTPNYMTVEEVRGLKKRGFLVGSHGAGHVDWTAQSPKDLEREIVGSKHLLEELLGERVVEAGVPFGKYNHRVLNALGVAGYRAVWTSDGGRMNREGFLRPRTSIKASMIGDEIERVMLGEYGLWEAARRTVSKLHKKLF